MSLSFACLRAARSRIAVFLRSWFARFGSLLPTSTCRRFYLFARHCFIDYFCFRRSLVSAARLPASTCAGFRWPRASVRCFSVSPAARRLPLIVAAFLAAGFASGCGCGVPASTWCVLLLLPVLFSWRRLFVRLLSRPRVRSCARKSPTSKRTRRCTRPPTAPFVSVAGSLHSLRFRRRVSLALGRRARLGCVCHNLFYATLHVHCRL